MVNLCETVLFLSLEAVATSFFELMFQKIEKKFCIRNNRFTIYKKIRLTLFLCKP